MKSNYNIFSLSLNIGIQCCHLSELYGSLNAVGLISGLTAFLQTELLSLSSEARRKHPEIKEAAERLSAILRSFKERPGYNISNELSKLEDALRPFVLACETKQIKLVTIAIGCIQRLISFHAIPETSVRTVLRTLTDVSVHGVDIQLKILQTVLPLLTNYNSVHDDILAEALLICFRLQDSKVVVVNNTAAATLRQLVIYVFDKVTEEDKQQLSTNNATHTIELADETTIKLYPCAKDAYYLFQDLCLLTNNEPPQFLRLGRLSDTFGLELIESVLTNHYTLFREHKELSSLLRERVCPMIIKTFSEKHDFPQTMRLTRVVYILIKQFSQLLVTQCEIFLSMFIKILEPENPLWQRVLAMEIFRGVCGNPLLLCSIYDWYDCHPNSTDVFRDMVTAFGRLATEKPNLLGANQGGRESIDLTPGSGSLHHISQTHNTSTAESGQASLSSVGSTIRIQCIDQLDKADPPPIPETYIFYLALLCLNSIADGLAGITLPKISPNNSNNSSNTKDKQVTTSFIVRDGSEDSNQGPVNAKNDLELVTNLANDAWPGLLAAMSFFITANLDEDLFQSTMRSYQNFTNVCGILGLILPRDAFLTNLCKNAIPSIPSISYNVLHNKNTNNSSSSNITVGISFSDLTVQQQQIISSITLSDKNLYSLRVLLNITMFLGGVLGSSWYLVLETLQQADFLLYNRPSAKGSSNLSSYNSPALRRTLTGSSISSGTTITSPAAQSSLSQMMDADHTAIILTSLNRLFENSQYLDDNAFIDFISALCRLNAEFSGVPYHIGEQDSNNKSSRARIFNNKSFAVEKLHEMALLNMKRLMDVEHKFVAWDFIMSHLIATVNYINTPSPIRMQSCDAISEIIIAAMNYILTEQKSPNELTQNRLLQALNECINGTASFEKDKENNKLFGTFIEVQRMGLETLNNLLQTSGHSFTCGWSLIFNMLYHITISTGVSTGDISQNDNESVDNNDIKDRSSIDTSHSSIMMTNSTSISVINSATSSKLISALIKTAFSSLQLICTDFLSLLSPDCLRQCIATLGAFGTQREDLNISLTSVGLLWNVSDFIQTRRLTLINDSKSNDDNDLNDEIINKENMTIDSAITNEESPQVLNTLWMLLLLQLSHICIDSRPEIRNGAIQTLFRTIIMNGNILGPRLWQAYLWEVLFPLLDSVNMASIRAIKAEEDAKLATSPSISSDRDVSGFLIHHSRDTADKQWDETKVLVLTGISNIYRDFLLKLYQLPTFEQAWKLLLLHLENSCIRSSQEVALAAMKSLKNLITLPEETKQDDQIISLWKLCWCSWVQIGAVIFQSTLDDDDNLTLKKIKDDVNNDNDDQQKNVYPPPQSLLEANLRSVSTDITQDTLTVYVNIFNDLYKIISGKFDINDVKQLLVILNNVLVYSTSPQYRPDVDHLSPLQDAVLNMIKIIDLNAEGVAPLVLMDLCEYMTLAFLNPQQQQPNNKTSQSDKNNSVSSSSSKFNTVTYIALNKRCSVMVADIFKTHVNTLEMYTNGVFERILSSYGVSMKLKYDCPPSHKHGDDKIPLWKIASNGFLDVLCIGLETLQNFGDDVPLDRFIGVWRTLIDIFEGNLLSTSTPPSTLTIEELDVDEHFDISILSLIQNDIVLYLGQPRVPKDIIERLIHIIHECSRLYYVDENEPSHRDDTGGNKAEKPVSKNNIFHGRTSDLISTTGTIVPVMKESFAYSALKLLFTLCSSEKQDYLEVRKRIAEATIPVLLERSETVLRNYSADEPLRGRCPFPRYLMGVRKEEILFCLQQSIKLKLQQDILETEEKGTIKGLLLSCPRAHLFYLYPSLCRMLTCEDQDVVELIRECLRVAGIEMGLEKSI
ncbi:unnamed protein product [Cunninghamella blakesleeana]